jgi:hypothetical protein
MFLMDRRKSNGTSLIVFRPGPEEISWSSSAKTVTGVRPLNSMEKTGNYWRNSKEFHGVFSKDWTFQPRVPAPLTPRTSCPSTLSILRMPMHPRTPCSKRHVLRVSTPPSKILKMYNIFCMLYYFVCSYSYAVRLFLASEVTKLKVFLPCIVQSSCCDGRLP